MAANKVEFSLEVKDNASAKIKKASDEAIRAVKNADAKNTKAMPSPETLDKLALGYRKASDALGEMGRKSKQAEKESETLAKKALFQQREKMRLASSYERIGVRSEKVIQREIQLTQRAYKKLADSGKLSSNELARAAQKNRANIAELNAELGKTSRLQKATNFGKGVAGVVAGVTAAGYVAVQKAKPHVDYNTQLARMANTAYSDRDVAGRKAGMAELDGMVRDAVNNYGGNRESAASTLNTLISSGAFKDDEIKTLLPTIQKYSTASGASPEELGAMAMRAKQTMGLSAEQIPLLFDKAIKAGDMGGFELSDMARWLPQQFAAGNQAGLSGLKGIDTILAANQAAMITAGSSDEAGNNLVNLLAKLNSKDLSKSVNKNMTIGGENVNLANELVKGRENGQDTITTFVGLMDRFVNANPELKKIQAQAQNASNDSEKQAALNDMTNLLEGSQIGKIISDRQALMGLTAIMGNRDYMNNIKTGLGNAEGTGQTSFDLMKSTAGYSFQGLENKKVFGQQDAWAGTIENGGGIAAKIGELSDTFPKLTAVVVGAADALTVFAAGAGVASVFKSVLGGGAAKGGGGLIASLLARLGFGGTASAATGGLTSVSTGGITAGTGAGSTALTTAGGGILGSLLGGAAPLAAMAGITAWAGKEDHKKELSFLMKHTERLEGIFGKNDPNIRMYDDRIKGGNFGAVPPEYLKSKGMDSKGNPLQIAAQELQPILTGTATNMSTSAEGFSSSALVMSTAADAMQKATNTPIQLNITVTPTDGLFKVIAEKNTVQARRD